jgi:hypothetical protein
MIFMVVDDSLAPHALADIRQMQAVGSSQDVDILVQLNWKESPVERYHVLSTGIEALTVSGVRENATRAELLMAFLRDAQKDFPADHYMLELWGHTYGIGFGRSDADRMPLSNRSRDERRVTAAFPTGTCNERRPPALIPGTGSSARSRHGLTGRPQAGASQ